MTPRPERTHVYVNQHLDSTRWDHVKLREGDIVISTSIKTGTTWTQRIVSLLLFGAGPLPESMWRLSPWIDARFHGPIAPLAAEVAAQTHRRFFKSHLPLDGLPYRDDVRYLVVGRDGRDVAMSLWNHYSAYNDFAYEMLGSGDNYQGVPMPVCPDDIHEFLHGWLTRGSFAWEHDGYPFWSHLSHFMSFWRFRHLPNIFFLHYSDLKEDLEGEMRRVAAFLGIEVDEGAWPALVDAASFESMKRDGSMLIPEMDMAFQGGASRFFHKGYNGQWQETMTEEELALYDAAEARVLDAEAARWLRRGRRA